jgi:hypothetical protein
MFTPSKQSSLLRIVRPQYLDIVPVEQQEPFMQTVIVMTLDFPATHQQAVMT